jgi:hypothetical protein
MDQKTNKSQDGWRFCLESGDLVSVNADGFEPQDVYVVEDAAWEHNGAWITTIRELPSRKRHNVATFLLVKPFGMGDVTAIPETLLPSCPQCDYEFGVRYLNVLPLQFSGAYFFGHDADYSDQAHPLPITACTFCGASLAGINPWQILKEWIVKTQQANAAPSAETLFKVGDLVVVTVETEFPDGGGYCVGKVTQAVHAAKSIQIKVYWTDAAISTTYRWFAYEHAEVIERDGKGGR